MFDDGSEVLPVLGLGLQRQYDGSGDDLHQDYAYKLVLNFEPRARMVAFQDSDAWGDNEGLSGSLIQHLFEDFSAAEVAVLLDETKVMWQSGCYQHEALGCVSDAETLEQVLDYGTQSALGAPWAAVRSTWEEKVRQALEGRLPELESEDRQQVVNLVQAADLAVNQGDAEMYRSIMEGFYCDWLGEEGRWDIAERVVSSLSGVQSEVISVYPAGTANFATARASILRTEGDGTVTSTWADVEHFPAGWRITWTPDWK
jgi:hypothetical protein